MSISVTTVEITHDGNAVASQYTYPFRIDNKSAIEVYVSGTQKTEGTDFTVSGIGGDNGGTVSFVASLVPGSGTGNVKFFRNSDPVHAIDYSEGGALPVANAEASWDRLAMVLQEHRDFIDNRCIKIPRTHTASSWNGSLGDPGVLSITSGTQVIVFRASGVDTVTASIASGFSPLTTQGDMLGHDGSNAIRVATGSTGAFWHINASVGTLATWGSGATSFGQSPYWTGSTVGMTLLPLSRLGLEASTTTSALTFTLIGENGSPASTANQAGMTFRSSVASTGLYSTLYTASVVQITLNEGATLNSSAASAVRAYLYGCNDGGEIKIGIARQALFDEGALQTTTAITSGADSANVLYTVSALTAVPVTLIGMAEFTAGAVAGSWETAPDTLVPWKPGMRKTGDVLNIPITLGVDFDEVTAAETGTTVIPFDSTAIDDAEGDEYFACTYTATSVHNWLRIVAHCEGANSASSGGLIMGLFWTSSDSAIAVVRTNAPASEEAVSLHLEHWIKPARVDSRIYSIRIGSDAAGTTTIAGTQTFGGFLKNTLTLEEVYA